MRGIVCRASRWGLQRRMAGGRASDRVATMAATGGGALQARSQPLRGISSWACRRIAAGSAGMAGHGPGPGAGAGGGAGTGGRGGGH